MSGCLWRVLLLAVIAGALGISFIWAPQINHALGLRGVHNGEFDIEGKYDAEKVITMGDEDARMVVHFVDVGQGDATLILTPSGQRIIIDAGTGMGSSRDLLMNYIKEHFDSDYMHSKFQSENRDEFGFDYAILTHAHEDHMGQFPGILERYGARVFYRPNVLSARGIDPGEYMLRRDGNGRLAEQNTLIYSQVISRVHNTHLVGNVRIISSYIASLNHNYHRITPKYIQSDDPNFYELVFYTPLLNFYRNQNDFSPVMILHFQGRSIVITGDAEVDAEREFVDRAKLGGDIFDRFIQNPNFSVCVIRLGHHGSRTSSNEFFLEFLTTEQSRHNVLAVISVGHNNRHGHPHPQVLSRLDNMGFKEDNILRTDIHGSIVVTISDGNLFVGGTVHRTDAAAVSLGALNLTWIEIGITLWVIIALTVFAPSVLKRKKR